MWLVSREREEEEAVRWNETMVWEGEMVLPELHVVRWMGAVVVANLVLDCQIH